MRRSRAFDHLRRLDPVADRDAADPGSPEARALLGSIMGSESEPGDVRARRVQWPRLATATVVLLLVVPAGWALWRAFAPLRNGDSSGTAGSPTASPSGTTSPEPVGTGEQLYEGTTVVLEAPGKPAMLCLSGVLESLPPQCGNIPVANWDWDRVEGEERLSGVTWGDYHVVGTYDGESFTLVEVGPPQPYPDIGSAIETPCLEPEGGWVAPDPDRTTDEHLQAALRYTEKHPDGAGFWIDYTIEPVGEGPYGPNDIVVTAAFTRDLDQHRAELERLWGGPLCMVEHERSQSELSRIQRELTDGAESEFGLLVLWSSTDVVHNQVELGVAIVTDEQRQAVEDRYGEGVVVIWSALQPVA
ncbi:MAG: hypothetical protein HY658_04900 [Actinobacteria bacterium]|nr:hypothetical protein [Actinomycetota bacterium]